jgi:aspartate racemase
MASVGIIGGIGPDSTIDYYRLLVEMYRERVSGDALPSILINSVDMYRMLGYIERGELDALIDYVSREIGRLAAGGADFALLAANTPHLVFPQLRERSPIPLVSIVEAACHACSAFGWTRAGLLGTRFTMEGSFYPEVFSSNGIEIFAPAAGERDIIHGVYIDELLRGNFLPASRDRIVGVINELKRRHDVQGVILAGTELPLLLRGAACDVPLLDTTEVHVRAVVERLLNP